MTQITREKLFELHECLCADALSTMEAKNEDYAGAANVFGNLDMCEAVGLCSTEEGILIRMLDKLSRLANFHRKGDFKVKDESYRDTIEDTINYAILLYAKYKERNGEQSGTELVRPSEEGA
jgi:hypothetical protein